MFRNLAKSLIGVAMLAGASTAIASEPVVLSEHTLDAVSAGAGFSMPMMPGAAFAYAYTSGTSSPFFQALINVGYTANVGIGQNMSSRLDISVNWNGVELNGLNFSSF